MIVASLSSLFRLMQHGKSPSTCLSFSLPPPFPVLLSSLWPLCVSVFFWLLIVFPSPLRFMPMLTVVTTSFLPATFRSETDCAACASVPPGQTVPIQTATARVDSTWTDSQTWKQLDNFRTSRSHGQQFINVPQSRTSSLRPSQDPNKIVSVDNSNLACNHGGLYDNVLWSWAQPCPKLTSSNWQLSIVDNPEHEFKWSTGAQGRERGQNTVPCACLACLAERDPPWRVGTHCVRATTHGPKHGWSRRPRQWPPLSAEHPKRCWFSQEDRQDESPKIMVLMRNQVVKCWVSMSCTRWGRCRNLLIFCITETTNSEHNHNCGRSSTVESLRSSSTVGRKH